MHLSSAQMFSLVQPHFQHTCWPQYPFGQSRLISGRVLGPLVHPLNVFLNTIDVPYILIFLFCGTVLQLFVCLFLFVSCSFVDMLPLYPL